MENIVKFVGYQADVKPYIAICDSMVMVSRYNETFSIAALESMAMEKPMIMTDIGGASEQIMDGISGYLYESGDTQKLSELMIRMSDQTLSRKIGEEASRQVRANFTLDRMVNNYEHLFLNLKQEQKYLK